MRERKPGPQAARRGKPASTRPRQQTKNQPRPKSKGKEKKSVYNVYEDSGDEAPAKATSAGGEGYEYELPSDFDDEEIDEDDVFNESDYERYGDVGAKPKPKPGGKGGAAVSSEESSAEESEDEDGAMDLSDLLGPSSSRDRDADILGPSRRRAARGDESGSEEEEEGGDSDDERHQGLLSAIAALDGTKQRHKGMETTETARESEYGLSRGARVQLADLMQELNDTPAFGGLKKQLQALQSAEVMPVPLAKRAKERINRSVAFKETAEDISKWTSVVKRNREAEHLSFPLNAPQAPAHSSASLTTKFAPETDLEREVAGVLEEAGDVDGNGLAKGELLQLQPLTLEELKERRKQLAKMRALMTYYERKRQRINKIKSKNYHRKLKKEKEAKERATHQEGAMLDASEHEKAERLRAEERMTLRHKNTSKWAKRLLQRKDLDPLSRAALEEQLRLGQQLRRKITLEDGEGSEEDSEGSSSDDEYDYDAEDGEGEAGGVAAKIAKLTGALDTPLPASGLMAMKFMQRALERQRQAAHHELRALQQQLDAGSDAESGASEGEEKDEDEEEEDDTPATGAAAVAEGELASDKVAVSRGHRTALAGFVSVDLGDQSQPLFAVDDFEGGKSHTLRPNRKTLDDDEAGSDGSASASVSEGEEEKEVAAAVDASNPWLALDVAPKGKPTKQEKKEKAKEVAPAPERQRGEKRPAAVAEGSDGSDAEGEDAGAFNLDRADDEQRKLIERAFAGDNVVEEFEKEKEELEDEGAGKAAAEPVLPGWGSWGGEGVVAKKQKKQHQPAPKEAQAPKPPRKDASLPHVIINEKRDKKSVAKLVKSLPHPFETRDQYERALRNPVGAEWNTPGAVERNVRPKITTKAGTVIEPLNVTKEIKMKKAAAAAGTNGKASKQRTK